MQILQLKELLREKWNIVSRAVNICQLLKEWLG